MRLGKLSLILFAGLAARRLQQHRSTLDVGGGRADSAPISAVSPDSRLPPAPASPAAQAAAISGTRMQFAPIIGAPVEQVTALSRRLSLRAKEKNSPSSPPAEKNATHVLKGYFCCSVKAVSRQ